MSTPLEDGVVQRTVLTLGGLALLGGLGTLVLALVEGQDLMAAQGVRLATLMHLNPLGSLVTIALAVATLAGGALRSRPLLTAAAAGWSLAVVQAVAQAGREPNVLGGTASTLAFFLAMAAALAALVLTPGGRGPATGAEPEP